MRADRLVATLLLLQARGHVTAAEVARELEVSPRTARRDLDALGMAGIPVYSQQGKGGGWRLAGRGRTDLSGLTGPEARALFLVAGPASSATPEVKAALRKLVHALPEPFREEAEATTSAVVVDRAGWGRAAGVRPPPPLLDAVQQAVVTGTQVRLDYIDRTRTATSRVVHPLGLAAKGETWYLVAGTDAGQRTFRVDRIEAVHPTGEKVVRPDGFDMREAWRSITEEIDQRRSPVRARALAEACVLWRCRAQFGTRVQIGPAGADGRVDIEVRGHSVMSLASELACFGDTVEVIEPDELRLELAEVGARLVARYSPAAPPARARAVR
ncbi:YafY family transcriptional regulator [Acidiferrimicrobium sp. IK]|uniref:helix-turn-helix transcriptional regulator n=1 Tax=Acidiferrimicrobium sp. IK TaxID=2871700 RepID=UPI0021CB2A82|nr:YafY family protein [Acidiferrimicrobium sp. IK]MCU4185821.1 YafY family transcriptional regulator [Acidiferrimicrobium sp. IK]